MAETMPAPIADEPPSLLQLAESAPLRPLLAELDPARRPMVATACERCPNSMWFASPTEVRCYCRVMFVTSWSSAEPSQIMGCDGMLLGQEQGK